MGAPRGGKKGREIETKIRGNRAPKGPQGPPGPPGPFLRHFGKIKKSKNSGPPDRAQGQHFLKKWIPDETSGHSGRLEMMAYGSSSYDLFGKNIDVTCKLQ